LLEVDIRHSARGGHQTVLEVEVDIRHITRGGHQTVLEVDIIHSARGGHQNSTRGGQQTQCYRWTSDTVLEVNIRQY
jgi:P2-related tail formation protein